MLVHPLPWKIPAGTLNLLCWQLSGGYGPFQFGGSLGEHIFKQYTFVKSIISDILAYLDRVFSEWLIPEPCEPFLPIPELQRNAMVMFYLYSLNQYELAEIQSTWKCLKKFHCDECVFSPLVSWHQEISKVPEAANQRPALQLPDPKVRLDRAKWRGASHSVWPDMGRYSNCGGEINF